MAMIGPSRKSYAIHSAKGSSMVELMIAMIVLAFGILASMNLIIVAMAGNGRSKQQSNSTALAQMVVERIMAVPASSPTTVTVIDCTNTVYNVGTSPGGAGLTASGDVNYALAAVASYNMQYTDCGTAGRSATYDVRWNVQTISGFANLLTVSSRLRSVGNNGLVWAPVVTVRTVIGQGT